VEKSSRTGQATDDNMIRHMRVACWTPKARNTHPEYVKLIAFPLQQWLQERASVLRYTYSYITRLLLQNFVRKLIFIYKTDILVMETQEVKFGVCRSF
jgi:hypothetical protein